MLRTIIVDDEPPALDRLEKLLTDSGLAVVEGRFTEAIDAIDYLKDNQADAVFLDIEMPDMDGIELANHIIDVQRNTSIVFVTACNQYAIEAFRLNALDYLLKPLSSERLGETLDRIIEENESSTPGRGVQVKCFGKFNVSFMGEEVKFRTEKARELLAFLINYNGGYSSRNKIIDSLWEDFEGDRAIAHLNTTLYYIKRALHSYEININIMYESGNYRMDMNGMNCDYLQFSEFAQTAGEVNADNITTYEEVASLYSGEYLAGMDYEWIVGKRLHLEEEYIHILLEISKYYSDIGDYHRATKWLKAGLQQEPLHRELNYELIRILILSEERMIAVKYYEIYLNGLKGKLGIEPDENFQRLMW